MGIKAHTFCQGLTARRKTPVLFQRNQRKFRMIIQKCLDAVLIFHFGKGTGRVQNHSPCFQHRCAVFQNIRLLFSAKCEQFLIPAFHHIRLFTEHAFPGTRGVNQNLVKKSAESFCQLFRRFTHNNGVGDAADFHVFQQCFCPSGADVIGNEQSCPIQSCRQLCGLSSGSGTDIQHKIPFFYGNHGAGCHGAGFLQIVQPRMVIGMLGRTFSFRVVKSAFTPGYRGKGKLSLFCQFCRRNFQSVCPKSVESDFLKRRQIIFVFHPQQCFHFVDICQW